MTRSNSTARRARSKPEKPYPEFPLFPHATRRWAKKIRGKLHYFGPWDDPQAALTKYLDQKDDLHAGRTPRPATDELTVRDLINRFLTSKKMLMASGEITARTFADYHANCQRVLDAFGKNRLVDDLAADDFEKLRAALSSRWGPVAVGNEIQRVRSLFKYGYDAGLIDKPVRFGPAFKRPSKKVLRLARQEKGPRLFEPAELKTLLKKAGVQLKAMILLGVNCGFGNMDCGRLPRSALDLAGGWVNFPRPKTGIERRAKLWPETSAAIKTALQERPEPKDPAHADLVFVTKYGKSWAKETGTLRADETPTPPDNPIAKEMRKLLDAAGIDGHRNFYALRHTFETIGGEAKDQVAVDAIMGHAREDMASLYREKVSDERLVAVAEHVHAWLFGKGERGRANRRG
jgi:integrase